jgi:hypothetical protein
MYSRVPIGSSREVQLSATNVNNPNEVETLAFLAPNVDDSTDEGDDHFN